MTHTVHLAVAVTLALMAATLHGAEAVPQTRQPLRPTPLDASGLIPYFIAEASAGSGFRPGDSELATWALQEWERRSGGALRFRPTDHEDEALVRIRWLPWSADGALGHTDPSVLNGRVVASIIMMTDAERLRPRIRRRVLADPLMRDVVVYFVCLHEIGHALGLTHSSDMRDIMWSGGSGVTLPVYERYRKRVQDREAIARASWLSEDDLARLRAVWARD